MGHLRKHILLKYSFYFPVDIKKIKPKKMDH